MMAQVLTRIRTLIVTGLGMNWDFWFARATDWAKKVCGIKDTDSDSKKKK